MGTTLLYPRRALFEGAWREDLRIAVEHGQIVAVESAPEVARDPEPGSLLPGFLDLQVNGAGGHSVDECTPEALDAIASAVRTGGAAAFLPTLITARLDSLLERVTTLAEWMERRPEQGAVPIGIHLEGPFLESPGTHAEADFIDPTLEVVDELIAAGRGHLRLVTLAPARRGAAEAVARLRSAGIAVALGHAASTDGFGSCVDAGARCVTHLFNAMSPLHHRAPGIVGRALDESRLTCSLILDGAHVDPMVARVAFRCLGTERTMLVTDSVAAAGMPDGEYALNGATVRARDGVVRDTAGRLAGSALTMRAAARNFLDFVPSAGLEELAAVAAANPARVLEIDDFGAITPGKRAIFTRWHGDTYEVVDASAL